MHDVKQPEPSAKQNRLGRSDELTLALLPTATVLLMLGLVKALGREHLLCLSLASSAFVVYRDPEHETNTASALIVSQMSAAVLGWAAWSLFGPGLASVGTSMAAAILLMTLSNSIHPPAVSTAVAFALCTDRNNNIPLFGLAVVITVLLIFLKHAVQWFLARRSQRRPAGNQADLPSPGIR